MKYLLILLICLPLLASAQRRDTIPKHDRSPGDELQLASKRWYLGLVLTVGGVAAFSIPYKNDDIGKTFQVIGGALGLVGFIMMLNSWGHINKAGQKMNERKIGMTFKDGIGVRYRI